MINERSDNNDNSNNDKQENPLFIHPDPHPSNDKKYYVYILESSDKASTYVGATINLDHRLRQHNKELVGGAHATSVKVAQGSSWRRVCHVKGFPDWSAALQFEWRLKQLSRKLCQTKNVKPIDRRIQALHQLLALERPTSKAKAYTEWNAPPEIVWENV
jgi:predicted GIY-YIG superfamily endonuclease